MLDTTAALFGQFLEEIRISLYNTWTSRVIIESVLPFYPENISPKGPYSQNRGLTEVCYLTPRPPKIHHTVEVAL